MGIILFIVALILIFILYPLAYIGMIVTSIVKLNFKRLSDIHLKLALELDELGNIIFADIFNMLLIKKNGYQFGANDETISSVLGKNKRDNTLTRLGKIVADILNRLDPNHVEKSIKQ